MPLLALIVFNPDDPIVINSYKVSKESGQATSKSKEEDEKKEIRNKKEEDINNKKELENKEQLDYKAKLELEQT